MKTVVLINKKALMLLTTILIVATGEIAAQDSNKMKCNDLTARITRYYVKP